MSVDRARELIMKAGTDASFREQIEAAGPADKKTLLAWYGFGDVTAADLQAVNASAQPELSDSALQTVAGGDIGAWVDWARDWYDYFTS
jgi:predicted ribosomally synthesized peptide with nif11-like leader